MEKYKILLRMLIVIFIIPVLFAYVILFPMVLIAGIIEYIIKGESIIVPEFYHDTLPNKFMDILNKLQS